ncbi:MAG: hypothetical protein M3Y27_01910, partial [Acidobacteriota bacterium]|nr:hypothetical protein [Acidobacteriota bacterium]
MRRKRPHDEVVASKKPRWMSTNSAGRRLDGQRGDDASRSSTLLHDSAEVFYMRKLLTLLGAAALLVPGSTVLAQAAVYDASCQPAKATMVAMVKTNRYRGTGTITDKGKAYPSGEIYVGDTLYRKDFESNWSRTAMTPQNLIDASKGRGITMHGCRTVGNESVNGEAAIVYEASSDMQQPNIHTDVKIWISARSGLPLRMDGQGAEGHLKTSMLFTYGADIRAPQDG